MKHRRERAQQEFRDLVAQVLSQKVSDPRLRLVTITDAELAPDLSVARVFYRSLEDPEAAARGLRKASPFIRRMCAELGSLRRIPEIEFRVDWGVDRGERVEKILAELGPSGESESTGTGDEGEGDR